MEKINIAELLRNCPKDVKLDCVMYEDVYFDYVDELNIIHCYIKNEGFKTSITFNQYGTPNSDAKSKCVIFPKGKTSWEGFHRPFRDGDILTSELGSIFILKEPNKYISNYDCYIALDFLSHIIKNGTRICVKKGCRFATEEEKQKLFRAINDNGYKWNFEIMALEKLPKFKVGDRIQGYGTHIDYPIRVVKSLEWDRYRLDNGNYIKFGDEHAYKLLKFDIDTLKPFDEVLFRMHDKDTWCNGFYSFYKNNRHVVNSVIITKQCIPYEGNEHLLNTTNDCDPFFKTWED